MFRSLQIILPRRVIPPPIWLVVFFVMCAIFIFTRNDNLEAMCLRNRQLQSSATVDELKTYIPDE